MTRSPLVAELGCPTPDSHPANKDLFAGIPELVAGQAIGDIFIAGTGATFILYLYPR